ncbi:MULTISPECIES: EthD family reductase [Thermoactinomyces]|jgi:uncharacterized protein (TIGR02118 family)|uniref:EthD family reductase n=1 Tax=Thermoactinomyces daqus TaxID=1329516 RepID=A0A7W1XAG4_9BACL|nr:MULTISPECIES: EthD family reductase [Thermoactinomyces]MBA4543020.1 EthD family reductase [Thermoactinomyces daqus]MBH8598681.1 EthD family reductase [Thermoactinomyces sp. CICC 10523]MBH8605060.1 EthD family reductase [Thermoactinomyces sp. CICC 10522]MBH8606316.1 EthD family reductase [Thermoactinomyces sp. CICC 10521]
MYKVIGLYKKTEKEEEFINHLTNNIIPQALKIPGIIKVDITHLVPSPSSPSDINEYNDYFLMCEIYFASSDALQQVLESEQGKAIAEVWVGSASSFLTTYVGKEESYTASLFTRYQT